MKINKFIIHNLLFLILILATFLRVWRLDIIPPGLTPDEASLGYNAYSILKTGRDEYGKILPVIFKSFGDYKPGLYVYLTIPLVAALGLNEWSVRLPSALAGILAVYLIYYLVAELLESGIKTGDSTNDKILTFGYQPLAIISSFLLAVSPWHINFSRGAWEVNVALTLTLAGILFLLRSRKQPKFLILSSFFFSLTLIAYQGAKLSTLIVIIVMVFILHKEIIYLVKNKLRVLLISFGLGILISLPVLLSFTGGQTGRLKVFSIFSYKRPDEYINNILKENNEKRGDLNYLLFHNNLIFYKNGILARYFNHFSGRFLFFEGDYQNPRHSAPNSGMLLIFDMLLLPVGFVALTRFKGRLKYFILLWLVLSPLPAVLTRDEVQAVRAFNMVIPLTLVSALGLLYLLRMLREFHIKKNYFIVHYLLLIILAMCFVFSNIYFFDSYFIHLPIHNAKYWYYGYKQAVLNVSKIQNDYQKVLFQQSYDQPYIYFLFYKKYDPGKYQKNANLISGGPDVGLVERLDNIDFVRYSWPFATGENNTLIVGNSVAIPSDFNPKDYRLINEIKYPDNFMTAFRILETK